MGLLHFHFSFFLGCPDGLQERFSMVLVSFWSLLGAPGGSKGAHLEPLWGLLGDSGATWGGLVGSQVIAKLFKPSLSQV